MNTNIAKTVLDAVHDIDKIFSAKNLPQDPWRTDDELLKQGGRGEISLNFVDLMELLKLDEKGQIKNQAGLSRCEQAIDTWKQDAVFRRRVVAILAEEGRGAANHEDYGRLTEFLRKHFPEEDKYRILVHAHAGSSNSQDLAGPESVKMGGNGIWAAFIPQAAQGGHNSSLVFLDILRSAQNTTFQQHIGLRQAVQCARHLFYLNFNTYYVPDDCPIWGGRVPQLLHTAFSMTYGEEWRQRAAKEYDDWSPEEKMKLFYTSSIYHSLAARRAQNPDPTAEHRLSPLVSDLATWEKRLKELRLEHENAGQVQALAMALMNANIRADFNSPFTLQRLVRIARNHRAQMWSYEKASQHQGSETEEYVFRAASQK